MDPHPLHRIHRIAIQKREASQAAGHNEKSAGAAGAARRIQKREEGDVTGRVDRGVAEGLEVLAVQPGRRVTGRGEGAKVVADLPKQISHAESTRLIGDNGHDTRSKRLVFEQVAKQPNRCRRGRHFLAFRAQRKTGVIIERPVGVSNERAALDTSRLVISILTSSGVPPHGIAVTTINPGFVVSPMTEKNRFKMPFLMSAERAARIIADGLERRKRVVQFPLPMSLLMRVTRLMPNAIYDRVLKVRR